MRRSRSPRADPRRAAVALTTDFGVEGHHAGVLRGVVLAANPEASVVDLSHGVGPGDVFQAALVLLWSWRFFPPGTVHCVVVDPGVGSARRAIAATAGGCLFVGPDNGALSLALADAGDAKAVALRLPAGGGLSATFHGRDVFAPAAARLSLGEPLSRLGSPVRDWVRLALPRARRVAPGRLEGEVIAVDRWGNLVTSVTAADLRRERVGAGAAVRLGRRTIRGISLFYAAAPAGEPLAVLNSNGHLEVAVNGGRADERFGAARGTKVSVAG